MQESESEKKFYRELLQKEFDRRIARNGRYSLRAFAKHLGVTHGALSKILAGKTRLSLKTAVGLTKKLQLDERTTLQFLMSAAERLP